MLRLLAKRHHDLIAGRTRAMCRLQTTVCFLIEPRERLSRRAPTSALDTNRILMELGGGYRRARRTNLPTTGDPVFVL